MSESAPKNIDLFRKPLPDELRAIAKQTARQAGGSIEAFFNANRHVLEPLVADVIRPDRLLKVAQTAIRQTPKLQECTVASLFGAIIICATMGLEPNTHEGHCFLIPRKKRRPRKDAAGNIMVDERKQWLWDEWYEVNVQMGYKGRLALIYRSPRVKSIMTTAAYSGDKLRIIRGTNPRIEHEIPSDGDRGEPVGYYAAAKLDTGEWVFEWMSLSDILHTRDEFSESYQQAHAKREAAIEVIETGRDPKAVARARRDLADAEDNPWIRDFDQMARKSTLTRIQPYLPATPHGALAAALDMRDAVMRSQGLGAVIDGGAILPEDDEEGEDQEQEQEEVILTGQTTGQPGTQQKIEDQKTVPMTIDNPTGTVPDTQQASGDRNALIAAVNEIAPPTATRWWLNRGLTAQQATICSRSGVPDLATARSKPVEFWLSVPGAGPKSAEQIAAALAGADDAKATNEKPPAGLFDDSGFGDAE
jgi:recombination protein RecT